MNIENNIKEIEYINENINKCNNNIDNFQLKLGPEKEEELTEFLNNIKTFGKLFNSNSCMIPYKWRKNQINNNFTLYDNDKTIEINYSGCYKNAYFLDYIFKEKKEYSICISMNTFGKKISYIYIGFMNENENLPSNNSCLCFQPNNSFYIQIGSETIFQGKSQYKVQIENKENLNLKFILNLKNKKLDIRNYYSNTSYRIIDVIGNNFRFFVGNCGGGVKIRYTILYDII